MTATSHTKLTYPQRLRAEQLVDACSDNLDALQSAAFELIALRDAARAALDCFESEATLTDAVVQILRDAIPDEDVSK